MTLDNIKLSTPDSAVERQLFARPEYPTDTAETLFRNAVVSIPIDPQFLPHDKVKRILSTVRKLRESNVVDNVSTEPAKEKDSAGRVMSSGLFGDHFNYTGSDDAMIKELYESSPEMPPFLDTLEEIRNVALQIATRIGSMCDELNVQTRFYKGSLKEAMSKARAVVRVGKYTIQPYSNWMKNIESNACCFAVQFRASAGELQVIPPITGSTTDQQNIQPGDRANASIAHIILGEEFAKLMGTKELAYTVEPDKGKPTEDCELITVYLYLPENSKEELRSLSTPDVL